MSLLCCTCILQTLYTYMYAFWKLIFNVMTNTFRCKVLSLQLHLISTLKSSSYVIQTNFEHTGISTNIKQTTDNLILKCKHLPWYLRTSDAIDSLIKVEIRIKWEKEKENEAENDPKFVLKNDDSFVVKFLEFLEN